MLRDVAIAAVLCLLLWIPEVNKIYAMEPEFGKAYKLEQEVINEENVEVKLVGAYTRTTDGETKLNVRISCENHGDIAVKLSLGILKVNGVDVESSEDIEFMDVLPDEPKEANITAKLSNYEKEITDIELWIDAVNSVVNLHNDDVDISIEE